MLFFIGLIVTKVPKFGHKLKLLPIEYEVRENMRNYLRFLNKKENHRNCFLGITSEVQCNTIFLYSGNKNLQSMP